MRTVLEVFQRAMPLAVVKRGRRDDGATCVLRAVLAGGMTLAACGGESATEVCPRSQAVTWTELPAPTEGISSDLSEAVWVGDDLVVWGTPPNFADLPFCETKECADVAGVRYNLVDNEWHRIPQADAPEPRGRAGVLAMDDGAIFWGGLHGHFMEDGGIYSPEGDHWELIPDAGTGQGRLEPSLAWTGDRLLVWGGYTNSPRKGVASGLVYDYASQAWSPMNSEGAPQGGQGASVAWTGRELVVWGGAIDDDDTGERRTSGGGALYDPETDGWRPMSAGGAPSARQSATALWTGSEVLIIGGAKLGAATGFTDGAAYDPDADSWRTISTRGQIPLVYTNEAVFTGTKALFLSNALDCHIISTYDPSTDEWGDPIDAPPGTWRWLFWTGDRALVFIGQPEHLGPIDVGQVQAQAFETPPR